MANTTEEFELKQTAASIAAAFSGRAMKEPSLAAAFQHASAQDMAAYRDLSEKIMFGALETAAAGDDAGKRSASIKLFDAMIGRAEIVTSVMTLNNPDAQKALNDFFNAVHSSPKYGNLDIASVYENSGAVTLAKAAKKTAPTP